MVCWSLDEKQQRGSYSSGVEEPKRIRATDHRQGHAGTRTGACAVLSLLLLYRMWLRTRNIERKGEKEEEEGGKKRGREGRWREPRCTTGSDEKREEKRREISSS